ncbi:MAG: PTS sugar transporter subunit IIA [Deltaproteobacteria bacterium]
MVGGIIVTHGSLAASLKEAAESIAGPMDNVHVVSVITQDATEGIRARIAVAVKEANSGVGVIIFTDMFGGTPTNIALSLLEAGRVEVITGVNLPVLLKFVGHRADKPLDELARLLREYGRSSIVLATDMLKEKK